MTHSNKCIFSQLPMHIPAKQTMRPNPYMHWPKVPLKVGVLRLNTVVCKLRKFPTNEQPEDRSFGLNLWRLRDRCRDSSRESGESISLNHVIAGPRRRPNQATQPGGREENICHTCVLEDAKKILAEQDRKHRERHDPKWDVLSGGFIPDEELTEDGKIAITY